MESLTETFFFDSYALIEVFKGSQNYEAYKEVRVITTYFNLYEAYYGIRREKNEEEGDEFFKEIKNFCIPLKFDWIKEATNFRLSKKKEDLSYVDCLGYIIAKDMRIKFLTGDKQFKDLPNVEFVK